MAENQKISLFGQNTEKNLFINQSRTCKNCGTVFVGNFCSHCGQRATVGKLTLQQFLFDALRTIDFEKGLLYTVRELTFRPGITVRNYIAGKRKYHYRPLQYIFTTLTLATFLSIYYDISLPLGNVSSKLAQLIFTVNLRAFFSVFFAQYLTISLLGVLPIMAFMSYMVFRSSKLNYTENLMLNLFVFGHIITIYVVLTPLNLYSYKLFFASLLLVSVFYLVYSYYRFFQIGIVKGVLKSLVSLVLSYLVYLILFFIALIVVYATMNW